MHKQTRLAQLLKKSVLESGLLQPRETVLVAVSGGPDSMGLLQILWEMAPHQHWKVLVAHFHHGLRGRQSDKDEAFVTGWAKKRGLLCLVGRADTKDHAREHRIGIEQAARDLRYAFLEQAAAQTKADKIALAHTADEQVETVLWRLMRGAVAGLSGMPARRPALQSRAQYVRPFLQIPKADILAFLRERRLRYRKDASNSDTRYTRNRIRHELIPLLKRKFNPDIVRTIAGTALALREQRETMESQARSLWEQNAHRSVVKNAKVFTLSLSALSSLEPALRNEVLKLAWQQAGGDMEILRYEHMQALAYLATRAASQKRWHLGGVWVKRERHALTFHGAT